MAEWQPNWYYFNGSTVDYNGFSYRSNKFHLSGSSFLDDWKPGLWSYNISDTGMAVWGENRELLAITPLMNSAFYKDSLTRTTTSSIPAIQDFQTQYAIPSPAGNYTVTFAVTGSSVNRTTTIYFSLSGYVNLSGTQYYSPAVTSTRTGTVSGEPGPSYNRLNGPPVVNPKATNIKQFGKSISSPEFGISFLGEDQLTNAIDQDYQSFYIHPKSDGSIIRTGTATSFPSSFNTVYGRTGGGGTQTGVGSLVNTLTQNITFDQAYDNPPLIFLTGQGSYPVALAGFITNSSGKYIGAAVVPPSAFGTSPALGGFDIGNIDTGVSPRVQITTTFDYFIVSNEQPVNAFSNDYGIRVNQDDGITETYSSSSYTLTISAYDTPKPYMYFDLNAGTYEQSNWGVFYTRPTGRAPLIGICLNNCLAITGTMRYVSSINGYYFNDDAILNAYGPTTLTGRYAYVNPPSNGQIQAGVGGFGTNSFLVGYGHVGRANIGNSLSLSWDFHIQNNPQMKQLIAVYDYGIGPY